MMEAWQVGDPDMDMECAVCGALLLGVGEVEEDLNVAFCGECVSHRGVEVEDVLFVAEHIEDIPGGPGDDAWRSAVAEKIAEYAGGAR